MTLPPIEGDPGRPRATDFARRDPWGGPTLRGLGTKQHARGATTGDLTRQWAKGPAN